MTGLPLMNHPTLMDIIRTGMDVCTVSAMAFVVIAKAQGRPLDAQMLLRLAFILLGLDVLLRLLPLN